MTRTKDTKARPHAQDQDTIPVHLSISTETEEVRILEGEVETANDMMLILKFLEMTLPASNYEMRRVRDNSLLLTIHTRADLS